MDKRFMFAGGAGAALLLLGIVLAPRGPSPAEIERALDGRFAAIEARIGENAEAMVALDERTALLDALAAEQGEAIALATAEMAERTDALARALEQVAEASAEVDAALELAIADLRAEIAAARDDADASADASGGAAEAEEASQGEQAVGAPAGEPEAGIAAGMLFATGQTARAGDGALRAFVSRIDDAGGTVTLSVNGTPTRLEPGQTATADIGDRTCRVSLVGIRDRQAALDMGCDGAPVGGDGGTAGSASQSDGGPDGSSAVPDGVAPGSVALLGDGAARVFVSSVAADGSAARIAVNGVTTQRVEPDERIEVEIDGETCAVLVGAIGGNRVALDWSCGS